MAKHGHFNLCILIILLLDITCDVIASSLYLSEESAIKYVDETYIVICKDYTGLSVEWKGPKGLLGTNTHPKVLGSSYGTALVFNKTRIGDTGNYTCSTSAQESKIFRLVVEDITYDVIASNLYLSKETAIKHVDDAYIVICKDYTGLSVEWKGPNGLLGTNTHPKVLRSSYGTALVFNKTRIGDTGNYTCSTSAHESKIFRLIVEDISTTTQMFSSSESPSPLEIHNNNEDTTHDVIAPKLYLSVETTIKHVGDSFIIICKDYTGLSVEWKGSKGLLGPETRPIVRQSSYGTAILFKAINTEDAGNYTCSSSAQESRTFRLIVEDISTTTQMFSPSETSNSLEVHNTNEDISTTTQMFSPSETSSSLEIHNNNNEDISAIPQISTASGIFSFLDISKIIMMVICLVISNTYMDNLRFI